VTRKRRRDQAGKKKTCTKRTPIPEGREGGNMGEHEAGMRVVMSKEDGIRGSGTGLER